MHGFCADDWIPASLCTGISVLLTVICGAYFLVAEVQQAIEYTGQQAITLDRGGFGAEELTMKQMELPKRYRDPTV